MDISGYQSADSEDGKESIYSEDAYNLDVWLGLFPQLGLRTLKRIKTRLESGHYKLDNFIPEDVLRRQLERHISSLNVVVNDLQSCNSLHSVDCESTVSSASLNDPSVDRLPPNDDVNMDSTKQLSGEENVEEKVKVARKHRVTPVYVTKCRHKKFVSINDICVLFDIYR